MLDRLQHACGKSLLLVFVHTTKAGGWLEAMAVVPSRNSGCFMPWLPAWETSRWGRAWISHFSCKQGTKRDGGAPVQQVGFAPPLPPQWYITTLTERGCHDRASMALGAAAELDQAFIGGWGLRWSCVPAAGGLSAISGVLYWYQVS